MNASYSIVLSDPFGTRLTDASNFFSLTYTRVVNDIGTMRLVLPGSFNYANLIIIPDGRVEIWRNINGREYLETDTVWLIKALERDIDDQGRETIIIEADTPLCVLREPGRFVSYFAGTAQAQYSAAAADNQIKQIARENIGTSASSNRSLAAYISIAANLGLGASIAKSFAWRDCLKVMQEFAAASTQAGTYLAFDIVAPTQDTLEFRTYTGQRGVDHRFPTGINPVILSPDMGNLGATNLRRDYRDEITYCLAAGQGEESARLIATSQDDTRIGASPFGFREKFQDATQYSSTTGLSNEAAAVVRAGRPRTIFKARLLDTADTRYGVHWGWGDFLTAQAFGQQFDCRVEAVSVSVENGRESIDAWLRSDS